MIIDTSAIVAIATAEPQSAQILDALIESSRNAMSAGTALELGIVLDKANDPLLAREADRLLQDAGIRIEPVTERQVRIARQAYRDFGKGNHEAGLNFGDCFAYALAIDTDEPLLFVGNDFQRTDVVPALPLDA